MLTRFVSVLCLAFIASCGPTRSAGTLGGKAYTVITPGTLQVSSESVSGTGSLVFSDSLSSDKTSYRMTVRLPDGAFADLITYSSTTLTSGATVRIQRSGNTIKGGKTTELRTLTGVSVGANDEVTVQIDVHNDEGHVVIWSSSVTDFTPSNASVSIEPTDSDAVGKGTGGNAWGLNISNATVTGLVLSAGHAE